MEEELDNKEELQESEVETQNGPPKINMKHFAVGMVAVVLFVGLLIYSKYKVNMQKNDAVGRTQNEAVENLEQEADNVSDTIMKSDVRDLVVEDLVVGDGLEATTGAKVSVHYTGALVSGEKFDSSLDRGVPFEFTIGEGQVIPGWEMGVTGMKVGGKRKLIIPPQLAYGERGAGGVIPPNSTLVFEIELLGVE